MERVRFQSFLKKAEKKQEVIEKEQTIEEEQVVEESEDEMTESVTLENVNESVSYNEESKEEYYRGMLNKLIELGNKDIELVKFAYFLHYSCYAKNGDFDENADQGIVEGHINVIFCHIPSDRQDAQDSRLMQCYKKNLFSGDHYYTFRINIWNDINCLEDCDNCVMKEESFSFCPYQFDQALYFISKMLNLEPTEIYFYILHNNLPPVERIIQGKYASKSVLEETASLDSKSSRAAHLMILFHFFEVKSYTSDIVTYRYLPLCDKRDKNSFVRRIIDFWNGKGGIEASMPAFNISAIDECKPKCEDCEFKQCPFQLAAYFTLLGNSINIPPANLSYAVSQKNRISNLNAQQHYQYEKYYDHAREMPYTPESFREYLKIIKYIINKSKNPKAPLLPLNVVFYTNDEQLANDFFDDFENCVWYFNYFQSGECYYYELSITTLSIEELIKKYEEAKHSTVFHIKRFELLENSGNLETQMPKLCKIMKDRKDVITVISGEKNVLKGFLEQYPELYRRIFEYHLYTTGLSAAAVFKLVRDKLELDFELDEIVINLIRDYIYSEYDKSELESNSYVEWLCNKIIFNHFNDELGVSNVLRVKDIPCIVPKRSEEEIFAELNNLVGLSSVKEALKNMSDYTKYLIKTKREYSQKGMHMVFSGNAGTGKTTVAKLVAEILYNIGYIKQNKLIMCSGKDLLGEYIGMSQQKTARKCEEAYGGVLFIDEAYQLNPFSAKSYTDTYKLDSVNELIQQMENNRSRLTVIFAGYTDEMEEFVRDANPGLQSRISYTIPFPDYSEAELMKIFKNMAQKEGLKLTYPAEMKVANCIHAAIDQGKAFGNARFCRNLFEHSEIIHARNVCNLDSDDPRLFLLVEEDIAQM